MQRLCAAFVLLTFAAAVSGQTDIPAPSDVAAPPADAAKSASGLTSRVVMPGASADKPMETDVVTVHYTGWTTEGKMFDSSVARGAPATMDLDMVIAGWTEGVALMVEGERTRFWIPENLAYKGEVGQPRGMLVFEIDLIRSVARVEQGNATCLRG